jgi:hypothetical protein
MDYLMKYMVCVGLVIFIGATSLALLSIKNAQVGESFRQTLTTQNITVIKGYIDSPSVRIPVDQTQFIQKAIQIGTVYQYMDTSFYVFTNPEQTIAYQYDAPIF